MTTRVDAPGAGLRALLRYWWLVVLGTGLAGVLGVLLADQLADLLRWLAGGTTGTFFAGVFGALGAAKITGSVVSGFKSMISAGFEFNSGMQQMRTTFTQLLGESINFVGIFGLEFNFGHLFVKLCVCN